MKARISFFIFLSFFYYQSLAQQSCSFVVHVDGATGTDNTVCGTEGSPCATINYGLQRAEDQGFGAVRVMASGIYNEIVVLKDGIDIWGGFDANWERNDTTEILGGLYAPASQYVTVFGENLSSSVVLSDLKLIGPEASGNGASTYAVYLNACDSVTIQRTTVIGGTGAIGTNGLNGSNATQSAVNGTKGANGQQFSTACDKNRLPGGVGGDGPGTAGDGGAGGRGGQMDQDCNSFGQCQPCNATSGFSGVNANTTSGTIGTGGFGGNPCFGGANGKDGRTVHGQGGNGAASSYDLINGYLKPTKAQAGSLGQDGTGGGGGGGAGGCDAGTDSKGAGGGGGGSGGFKAPTAGAGATSGGSSCGIMAVNTALTVSQTLIIKGAGGNGGKGGDGGAGTAGGFGGAGGNATGNTGAGGSGGNGGHGGHSGAGGGGAGGNSCGIYAVSSSISHDNLSFTGGSPGAGGNGGQGDVGQCHGSAGVNGSLSNFDGSSYTEQTGSAALVPDPCVELIVLDVSSQALCPEEDLWVAFNAVGEYDQSNQFQLQLSDATGDFGNNTVLSSVQATGSDTFEIQLPNGLQAGSAYRFRVRSSQFDVVSQDNGQNVVLYDQVDTAVSRSAGVLTVQATGAQYQWIDCDNAGVSINGETSQSYTPDQSGHYACVVTDANCSDTSACHLVSVPNAIEELYQPLRIYPNPSQGLVFIELPRAAPAQLQIRNVVGESVHRSASLGERTYSVELDVAPGCYLVEVIMEGRVFNERLIID